MKDIEVRVERGPVAQNEPFAIGMAKLLEREGKTVAATELRRLHEENGALKKAVALLQQHHATAWNRGHMMGMKTNEDTARRALDAVRQDAWGNTQLTEALLKAEAQRDALLEALKSTGLFLHHCWCDVAMNDYSLEKLDRQMEIVDAAIKAVKETK